jgi:hypothetical protein
VSAGSHRALLYAPRPTEVVNSFQTFGLDRPDQVAATYLRASAGLGLPPYVPTDGNSVWDFWIDRVVGLILNGWDFVGIVTGDPGVGKSVLTLQFASRLRNALNAELGVNERFDTKRDVLYRLSDLAYRVYQSSGDNPVVLQGDEGCTVGAQAQAGASPEGIILDQVLSVCRIKATSLFLLHPSILGVASFIRQRRGRYWFHVESPSDGSPLRLGVATAFRATAALPREALRRLPFVKERQPFHRLRFGSLDGDPLFTAYSAEKIAATDRILLDLALRAVALEFNRGLAVPEWSVPILEDRKPAWWTRERVRLGKKGGPLPPLPATRLCRWGCGKGGVDPNLVQHEAFCAKRPKGK